MELPGIWNGVITTKGFWKNNENKGFVIVCETKVKELRKMCKWTNLKMEIKPL